MKIVETRNFPDALLHCIFCGEKVDSRLCCYMKSTNKIVKWKLRDYKIHLSCGYKWLKNLRSLDAENKQVIKELEGKYLRELTIDLLKER